MLVLRSDFLIFVTGTNICQTLVVDSGSHYWYGSLRAETYEVSDIVVEARFGDML